MTTTETAAEFLTELRDYLYVYVAPSVRGDGWDVVVRIDGTYGDKDEASAAAVSIRAAMEALSDVPMEGRDWWDGPRP